MIPTPQSSNRPYISLATPHSQRPATDTDACCSGYGNDLLPYGRVRLVRRNARPWLMHGRELGLKWRHQNGATRTGWHAMVRRRYVATNHLILLCNTLERSEGQSRTTQHLHEHLSLPSTNNLADRMHDDDCASNSTPPISRIAVMIRND